MRDYEDDSYSDPDLSFCKHCKKDVIGVPENREMYLLCAGEVMARPYLTYVCPECYREV